LLAQAQVCSDLINDWHFTSPEAVQLLYRAGTYAQTQGRFSLAKDFLVHALAIHEQTENAEATTTAALYSCLGLVYNDLGDYVQAETSFQRSKTLYEQLLGTMHPEFATILDNLAGLYDAQGKYAQAESLYLRALDIRERTLGPEHPRMAIVMSNLAGLYVILGKYKQAEDLYQQALTIDEKALGLAHPDVAISLNNLAHCYDAQGKYEQAPPLYRRALQIDEQTVACTIQGSQDCSRTSQGTMRNRETCVRPRSRTNRHCQLQSRLWG